jgi:hypothetical protein
MEVMQWEVSLRKGKRRCESISTGSCWLAPAIKEGRNENDEIHF